MFSPTSRAFYFSLVLFLAVTGCSSGKSPIATDTHAVIPQVASPAARNVTSRFTSGLWRISVADNLTSATVEPDRTGMLHLNMVNVLQSTLCDGCLYVHNVIKLDDNTIQADVRLRHPYPGKDNLTGFDVRGIFISKADYTFPVSGRKIAYGNNVPSFLILTVTPNCSTRPTIRKPLLKCSVTSGPLRTRRRFIVHFESIRGL